MVERELARLIAQIQARKCDAQSTEVKAAHLGCPEKLYDTLSSFSNQDSGGVLVFGLDERRSFEKVGVYDAQDLQKKVMEYCEQMTPVVRPVFTVYDEDGMVFVSAEIPPMDVTDRPCFKTAKGRLSGSYIRVGDADKPMTEYEVYSYEAFRKKYRDDIQPVEGISMSALDQVGVEAFLNRKCARRPNLALLTVDRQYELAGLTRDGRITLSALLLFGVYPQAYCPQLCVIATCVPGREMGEVDASGNRFTDSRRIEGTLKEMLDGALAFVAANMRIATRIDPTTGVRTDIPQYPPDAVREAILNALVHRDYSIHTQGMPIRLIMFNDRLEISSPGGLYGRLTIDQLGHVQPDTRNPVIVSAMETLGCVENRYSGIPTIRMAMQKHRLPDPLFINARNTFTVVFYNAPSTSGEPATLAEDPKGLVDFCRTPRSRDEIVAFIGVSTGSYALRRYLQPLLRSGAIRMTNPEAPRHRDQRFVAATDA